MNPASQVYWMERWRLHGHTGWSDPLIYAYDQLERLKLVKSVIPQLTAQSGYALDFGCGVGDFSKMLIGMGFKVCGYDPFIRPRVKSSSFSYAATYEQIACRGHQARLALSITTLDHILDDQDAESALAIIHNCVAENGDFLMMEYALDSVDKFHFGDRKNNYQALRAEVRWVQMLEKTRFQVMSITPVSHPTECPSPGFLAYRSGLPVKARKLVSRLPFWRSWYRPILDWWAAMVIARYPEVARPDAGSPLKLFHCKLR